MKILIILIMTFSCFSAFENIPIDPEKIASGGLIFSNDDFRIEKISLSVLYPYEISEFIRTEIRSNFNIYDFNLLTEISHFGLEEYKETSLTFSLGSKLLSNFIVSPILEIHNLNIENSNEILYSGGCRAIYNDDNFSLGVSLTKIFSSDSKKIAPVIFIDTEMFLTDEISISSEIESDGEEDVIYKFGAEYKPFESIKFLVGINPELYSINGGFSFKFSNLRFSYGVAYHNYLGLSHSSGIIYDL
ncbi:MAG: hypothetical protein JXR48_14000 [Candidatus Delongbacteria bacterium]|nr:hypothetical protein [Candidatus Delongbacteria bacterium]MBN2836068.1 hypothetical protein [Candidatus Delongbacteria bacterium]